MIDQKDVTIIIPHYGASKEMCYALRQTKGSLYINSPEIKTLVVKNGPYKCDCLYDIGVNDQGQCKAVNAAIATINTPWVLITNDDMVYPPGWWDKLTSLPWGTRETHKDDPNKFCISPMLIEPRPGAPTFLVEFCGGAGGDFDKKKWLEFANKWNEQAFPLRTGFNFPILIKRKLWNLLGGYDINYDPWGSNGDSDLEYKIRLAGIQPYQNTNCIVYHFSQTSGTFHPDNDSYRFKNYGYFKQKWGFDRTDNGIWEANFSMPTKKEGRIYFPEWEGKYGN
jgi:hypothetical protein